MGSAMASFENRDKSITKEQTPERSPFMKVENLLQADEGFVEEVREDREKAD